MAMSDKNTRRFEMEIDIAAPPANVWNAIANDVELRRWFAPDASIDLEVGGEIVWAWKEHSRWAQRIEILEPGKRLRTRYDSNVDDEGDDKKPLFIDFTLEGKGGTTTLRLVQSGFGPEASFDAEYDGISRGWPVELRSLRLYLEQHAGKDRHLAWSMMHIDIDSTEAWQRLTSDAGFACGTEVESMQEGERFRFVSVDGDVFSGHALQCHTREFSGDASSHGGAFFRISVKECNGKAHVWVWLGAYDRSKDEMTALQRRWDRMLEQLFEVNSDVIAHTGL